MDARFYNSEEVDIERLASDLVSAYQSQGYKAQYIGNNDQVLVQIKKGGDFEAVLGMQAVLSITIQRTSGGILAMIGQQRWVDKAAVGAVGIAVLPLLWPLAVTASVGAVRQASLGNQALNMVDGLVRQQRPGISGGPVPSQFLPQVQRQWEPLPSAQTPYYLPPGQVVNSQPAATLISSSSSSKPRCTQCNTPYDSNDTFCSSCGRPLAQRKVYCPNCNCELKPGLSFCSKCGTATFQSFSATQQTVAGSAPESAPPLYTPPTPPTPQPQVYYVPSQPANDMPTVSASNVSQQPTPTYTPPSAPADPPVYYVPSKTVNNASTVEQPTPAYTPPSAPADPPVYYVPSQPANHTPMGSSSSAPQASTQYYTPSAPQEPQSTQHYVPPVPQDPPVKPQPKVTIIQSTPRQEPPPPKPRPQIQYYIPSDQAQTTDPTQTRPASPSAAAQSQGQKQPLVARPVSRPLGDPNVHWGVLTFSDGQQIQLSGERAVVGRHDHDLDGVPPEVDLGQMQGADTVSRMHALLEHIGSTYTLTDLNSTNATRINGKRLEPDKAAPINDGDTLQFGKIICTFSKGS
jgi:pSer/pThr/pTyr-binding forkhead associated (FHA) protein